MHIIIIIIKKIKNIIIIISVMLAAPWTTRTCSLSDKRSSYSKMHVYFNMFI